MLECCGYGSRFMSDAIVVEGLGKRYGDVIAVEGLNLTVPEGTVMGLLGPNGAGKTTTVRILTTLLKPDTGRATVAGLDVVTQAQQLRKAIGLSGQYAAVDENLTGFENLEMVGRLYHMGKPASRARAEELLERFDLDEAGRTSGQDVLGRHAPSARPSRGARCQAKGHISRRAHDRARSSQPHRPLDRHLRARPGRRHPPLDDALS